MVDSPREIENLLYLYAERIDAGDFDGVADLFRHGCILGPDGEPLVRGREQVRGLYETSTRLYENGTPCTQHVTSNVIIEVDDTSSSAAARSRFTVFQCLPDFPLQAIIMGRYADRFEYLDGGWWFVERDIRVEHVGDVRHHLLIELPYSPGG